MSGFKMVPVSFLAPEHLEMILAFFFPELSLLLLLRRGSGDPETVPFTASFYQFLRPQQQVQNAQSWK